MSKFFLKQGRTLLSNGYLIVPIKAGEKRPALAKWQNSRFGVAELQKYADHGVGILCGQGAHPIVGIDVDTMNAELADKFVEWCCRNLGVTVCRVGKAPKTLLVYRAQTEGWAKGISAWFEDPMFGGEHRLEVLGKGQQFVAYHIHPETLKPYEWTDFLGGLETLRANELPVITEEQVVEAIQTFEQMAHDAGLRRRGKTGGSEAPPRPQNRSQIDEEDFFGRVNQAAIENLSAWVPVLFPSAREYGGGFRVASIDLGRDLEEDIAIAPNGIVDFGVADMGDEREGKRTPIDLVLEWATSTFDDPMAAPMKPYDAALWLCDQLGADKETFGFGLRRKREVEAQRSAKRLSFVALLTRLNECDDSLVLAGEVAELARKVVTETPELRAEVYAAFKSRYRELTNVTLTQTELDRMLRDKLVPTVKTKRPLTEFGNADRMIDQFGAGMMYTPETNTWYSWNGTYWNKLSDVGVEHFAKETVRSLVTELDENHDTAEFFKFCAMSQQAKMVRNMVSLAASDPKVMVPFEELDKDSNLIGVHNGVVDLRTGELRNADPELRISKTCGCAYDPRAKAPVFEQTVLEVFNGDVEMVKFFKVLMGYTLMGQPKLDFMVIPFGNGSNGKSTVLGAVRSVFGDYARSAEASSFVSDGKSTPNAGGAREDLLRLRGARFVYVNEPDDNSELREGSVKAMTGGDEITARGVYSKETVEITPTWVVFMPTNHKPIVKGSDNGIWRRLMLIPFTRNFENDPKIVKDPDRERKLDAERSGILNWMIAGALEYQRDGLKKPDSIAKASANYREEMDLLSEWINEYCDVGPEYSAEVGSLWNSWSEYAKRTGLISYIRNSTALGRRLETRFPSYKGGKGVRYRMGIRLRDPFPAS